MGIHNPPQQLHHHHPHFHPQTLSTTLLQWHEPSRQPASPLVAKHHVSSSPPRPLASPHHLPVVSRSHTDISQAPSLSVRSVATRSRLSSSSSVWFVRSRKTSSPTCASSHLPSVLCRSPLRLTSSRSSRTPTCAPSTLSVSPSSRRTSSSLVASVVSALRCI